MLKKSLVALACICCSFFALAQHADSVAFVNAKWKKQRVARKVMLMSHHFDQKNLFSGNENISYLEVKTKGKSPSLSIGAEKSVLKNTSDFGKQAAAVAAVNGTFFDVKNGGSQDYIRIGGKVLTESRLVKNHYRTTTEMAVVAIDGGDLSIVKRGETEDWESKIEGTDVMVTGPLLRFASKDQPLDSSKFNVTRHPRTCIGIKPGGRVILLTVDGRNKNSEGMSLFELTKVMRWLGCTSAINLDGGGSTTLWIDGFPENGIVNYPTDNKKWDHGGERKVANVILINE